MRVLAFGIHFKMYEQVSKMRFYHEPVVRRRVTTQWRELCSVFLIYEI